MGELQDLRKSFQSKAQTQRFCAECGDAFCEGEHGQFYKIGVCVRCYNL